MELTIKHLHIHKISIQENNGKLIINCNPISYSPNVNKFVFQLDECANPKVIFHPEMVGKTFSFKGIPHKWKWWGSAWVETTPPPKGSTAWDTFGDPIEGGNFLLTKADVKKGIFELQRQ